MAQTLTQDDLDAIAARVLVNAANKIATSALGGVLLGEIMPDGTTPMAHGGTLGSSTATLACSVFWMVSPDNVAFLVRCSGDPTVPGALIQGLNLAAGSGASRGGEVPALWIQAPGYAPAVEVDGPFTAAGPAVLLSTLASNGSAGGNAVEISAAGAGKVAVALADDAGGTIGGGFAADPEANRGPTAGDISTTLMIERLYRLFFRDADRTPTAKRLLANDGTTPIASQPVTDDGAGTETQGPMS